MPSKSRLFSQLIAGSGQIKADRLSDDISTIEQVATTEDLTAVGNTVGDQRVINNNLYIWNGTGWYRIALINASPTWDSGGQPETTYTLDADSPQDATVITLAASDPDGLPISYNYITSGQMDSIATISQDSSVFTITPKTEVQAPDGGTGSITFRATDGINILPQVSSFTLNFISIVENSNHTTLLATATDTSDNNNITDSSSNNHSITVNGDAYAGTFSPYRSGGYSVYLDDGEEISFPDSSNYNVSNGSFSIEAWVYPTSYDSPWSGVISQFSSSSRGWGLAFSSTQITFLGSTNGGSSTNVIGSVTSSVPLNQWTHLLVTRDSNTIRIFNNGVLVNNFTESGTFNNSTNPLRIGELNSAASENFRGYIRDARVVKGSVPTEYQTSSTTNSTTIFSVPSEPLTAVTNTVLLTCHLPYISDGSANDATPTLSGNVSTKPFSPYDYNEYSAADNGGSVYFDGTTDYLLINSPPTLGANDWTFETWYYSASVPLVDYNVLLSQGPGNNGIVSNFSVSITGEIWIQTYTTTNVVLYNTAAGTIKGGMWNHIVLTHDYDGSNGGTYTIYANGNQVGNVSYTSGYYWNSGGISGTPLAMAQYRYNTQANSACYFSDWKISNSVIYSSDFIPPTAPLSSTAADLHIKGTDASIIDKSQNSNLKLFGNTTGSTTQVKFSNTKSMYFDGSGDYIITPQQELGTGDFTIEGWHYLLTRANNRNGIFGNYSSYTTGSLGMFAGHSSATTTAYQVAYNGAAFPASVIQGGTIVYNQWVHFAVVRNSGTMNLYINGTSVDSISATASLNGVGSNFIVGAPSDNLADGMQGYLQDFRITKGLARYTANFTPPSASLKG